VPSLLTRTVVPPPLVPPASPPAVKLDIAEAMPNGSMESATSMGVASLSKCWLLLVVPWRGVAGTE